MNNFKITKASIDDILKIMELANKAFEENGSIGDSGLGFKKKGTKRFKDSKSVEDILDILYVLKSLPQNNIIGMIGARIKSDSKTVHISHLAIDFVKNIKYTWIPSILYKNRISKCCTNSNMGKFSNIRRCSFRYHKEIR